MRKVVVAARFASEALTSPDTLSVLDKTLPVSRKYKESVKAAFPSPEVPNGHGL